MNYSAGAATGPHLYAADVSITKTAAPSPVVAGDDVTYTLTVSNSGPLNATSVTVTDTLPTQMAWVSATPSQGSCSGTTTVTCSLGTINNGSSATITIVATATRAGTFSNTASVTATEFDPDSGNNSSTVPVTALQVKTADVSIVKAATASVSVGNDVTYTLTVHNNGPETADGVTVADPLPVGLTWKSTTTSVGVTCTGTSLVTCTLGNMASGATALITITATANSAGTKLNMAAIAIDTSTTYDPNPINDSATATHHGDRRASYTSARLQHTCLDSRGRIAHRSHQHVLPGYRGNRRGRRHVDHTRCGAGGAGAQVAIAVDDLLMVIQMQDAQINITNTANYGGNNGTGAGATAVNAGTYEFARAATAVPLTGGTLTLKNALLNAYTDADDSIAQGQRRFQVVRVPQYTTATLSGVTAAPWLTNTAAGPSIRRGTGGILAIDVQGVLTVNSGLAAYVDGMGFRGAGGRLLNGYNGSTNADWRTLSTHATNGGKGEGNAGTPANVSSTTAPYLVATGQLSDGYPFGSMARGAPGNAGGGSTDGNPPANDQNSGGGGGSNGGKGGTGGHSWSTDLDLGGVGAAVIPTITQLVLGGGGGAGTRNNAMMVVLAERRRAGGGLMVIRACEFSITPGPSFSANGAAAYDGTAETAAAAAARAEASS